MNPNDPVNQENAALDRMINSIVAVADLMTVVQIVNDTQGADDMSDHDGWISYSHWGMFTLGRRSSN